MDSSKDRLTGFYTESFMQELLDREVSRAERFNRDLSFMMFDFIIPKKYSVDMHFPVFKQIAKEINARTRKIDIKVRIGNRILVILPETDNKGAQKVATKITEALREIEFYHPPTDEKFKVEIKFSIGLFPKDIKERQNVLDEIEQTAPQE